MSLSGIVLVTGGAGFIGSHLVTALLERGDDVSVIDDLSTGHSENIAEIGGQVDFIHGSLNDEQALKRALEGAELVFHEAAIPSVLRSVADPAETHRACVEGTFALLNAARATGVRRLIYAASSSAYGDQRRSRSTKKCAAAALALRRGEARRRALLSGLDAHI